MTDHSGTVPMLAHTFFNASSLKAVVLQIEYPATKIKCTQKCTKCTSQCQKPVSKQQISTIKYNTAKIKN